MIDLLLFFSNHNNIYHRVLFFPSCLCTRLFVHLKMNIRTFLFMLRPQEIDEASRRRFVKRLYIPLPEAIARRQIVENLMSQQKHHLEQNQLQDIVDKSDGKNV